VLTLCATSRRSHFHNGVTQVQHGAPPSLPPLFPRVEFPLNVGAACRGVLAKFCDAVAVMPEATWFYASPNHKVCGQAASFYHFGRTKIEGNRVGTRHVWVACPLWLLLAMGASSSQEFVGASARACLPASVYTGERELQCKHECARSGRESTIAVLL
jgi:hypothetical protein